MFKTYFKIAWRSIATHKGFSIINILGLSVGITCTILIMLWVQDELSWDQFHINHSSIYKLMVNRDFNGDINTDNAVPFPLVTALRSLPQIKYASVDDYGNDHVLSYNNNFIKKRGFKVSGDYFKIFRWKFIAGSPTMALSHSENIVITQSLSQVLFGNDLALNKSITIDNGNTTKKVVGVLEDPAANSSIKFDFIGPFDSSSFFVKAASGDWENSFTEVFVETTPGAQIGQLNRDITTLVRKNNEQKADYFLYPMDRWRLFSEFKNGKNNGGRIGYVILFTIIGIIIWMIACLNSINLATAKFNNSTKKIGIRKILGSARRRLMLQFYTKSFILAFLAFCLSIGFVLMALPWFNSLLHKNISIDFFKPLTLLTTFLLIVFTGLISGSYPALCFVSFKTDQVPKAIYIPGKFALLARRVLIIFQFVISFFFTSAAIVVCRQIKHAKDRDIGYNPYNLISIPSSAAANKNARNIKDALIGSHFVVSVTQTSSPVTDIWNYTSAPDWEGKPPGENFIMTSMSADANFARTLDARLVLGRDFTEDPLDSCTMLLNKAAMNIMQLRDPLGMQMTYSSNSYTIIGITEDLLMGSPYEPVMPMMILPNNKNQAYFLVRLKESSKSKEAIAAIGAIFSRYSPGRPFEYKFSNEEHSNKFIKEEFLGKLIIIFTGLAIFTLALGLWGLTTFTVEKKYKEIGIRKMLGVSIQQLFFLMAHELILLFLIAFVVYLPLAWWLLNLWLQSFAYRIEISPCVFIVSAFIILIPTTIVVWVNSFKAAIFNQFYLSQNNF
ncbi:MAG: ABC transporter permease [Flavisolibacter sp.]